MRHIRLSLPTGNPPRFILTATIAVTLTFTACERKPAIGEVALPVNASVQPAVQGGNDTTFETTRLNATIGTFEKASTTENQAWVRVAFAVVDAEILELEDCVTKTDGSERADAAAKLNDMQKFRAAEMARYSKSPNTTTWDANPPVDNRTAAQKVEDATAGVAEKAGNEAKKVGKTLENEAGKTGDAVKDATR